jgi:CheY-like chemotaxis protein
MQNAPIYVLAAVRLPSVARYRESLGRDPKLKVTVVTNEANAREMLAQPTHQIDVFVVDHGLGKVFELIKDLRQHYPRLLILLVDEEADFGTPGRADDVSTTPFKDDELLRKIKRLAEERRLETLRADALPPVRSFAKTMQRAAKGGGRQQAAVEAVRELGYDYVAFYTLNATEPPSFTLTAQVGPDDVTSLAQMRAEMTGLIGWVSQNGTSRIVGPGDQFGHILGVLLAFRDQAGSIKGENVLMLELISAQLASALAKEQRA